VCKYVDPNCLKTSALGDCLECLKGYYLKNNGLCGYQDTNCLSFDNATGLCALCKPYYYFNQQGQICIPLPANCIQADLAGRCTTCQNQFTLTSAYQCLFVAALPSCRMVSASNNSLCATCIDGYFADPLGRCQRLPPFCSQVDPRTYACLQCSPNGLMKGTGCVDKNCQIFDGEGGCLACLRSFSFGQLGECVPEMRDPNCKEYQFGLCKLCSERYFFDFQFNCVPVSPFCQTYDPNAGDCTSCYAGYQLTTNGDCTVMPFASLLQPMDLLASACRQSSQTGQCLSCNPNFTEVPLPDGNGTVSCVQKISSSGYCLQSDNVTGQCLQCVTRMFPDKQGTCVSIHENCDKYNSSTGECISCYAGFTLAKDNRTCSILTPEDPNC
jgi:hypothetical protein